MSADSYKKLTLGWSVIILFLTLTPGADEPGWFDQFPHLDKLAHFSLFAVFAGLSHLGWVQKKTSKKDVTILRSWIIGSGIVLSAATELLQFYVPYRNMDWLDWIADIFGLGFGLLTFEYVKNTIWSRN